MVIDRPEHEEFSGLLRRDAGGFILQGDDGNRYQLVLLRTPVDAIEKRVIVAGDRTGEMVIEATGVRLADGG
jgi:hypothetical protein